MSTLYDLSSVLANPDDVEDLQFQLNRELEYVILAVQALRYEYSEADLGYGKQGNLSFKGRAPELKTKAARVADWLIWLRDGTPEEAMMGIAESISQLIRELDYTLSYDKDSREFFRILGELEYKGRYAAFYPDTREVLVEFDTLEEGLEFAKQAPIFLTSVVEAFRAQRENNMIRWYFDADGSMVDGGKIFTTQYQNWKTVTLLKGLGFEVDRERVGDNLVTKSGPVVHIFHGWEPSKDGSRLTSGDDLSNPDSPHYGRRYLDAFLFWTPEGYADVVVWNSSPHGDDQLYEVVGLSSYEDWKVFVEERPEEFGLSHWLEFNSISL